MTDIAFSISAAFTHTDVNITTIAAKAIINFFLLIDNELKLIRIDDFFKLGIRLFARKRITNTYRSTSIV